MNTHLDEAPVYLNEETIAFGAFQLNRMRRALLKDGRQVALGCRAMDILLVLTDQAGAVVSNRELLRRVWPNVFVEDGTVRVHIASLRKALRRAEPGSDYIHSVTGRGYRFVGAVSRQRRASVIELSRRRNNLPSLLMPVFGREETIQAAAALLARHRLVTIAGSGGTGKTTVAIKTADSLARAHALDVCFVDLAISRRRELPGILTDLSKLRTLLVLDNCEHAIEVARQFAEAVIRNCPLVNILATSREPLRAAGEVIKELAPLELGETLASPAVRMFVDRASAGIEIGENELPLVANICNRLAGNPLAIEIVADQVRWLGVRALCAGLHESMYFSIQGRRTAERRHRTLRASFDWSYDQLCGEEQAVFRRLSVLDGSFTPELAAAVIAGEGLDHQRVPKYLVSLARKSLIAVESRQRDVLYRLEDLARAYAREKLHQSQELLFRCFGTGSIVARGQAVASTANRFMCMN